MFELAGLSTFLDIFQKAFGLIEKRRDQRRRLFEEIVEPVYTQLSVVVGQYYGFYRSFREDFREDFSERNASNWETVFREKRKQREEMVLARNQVIGLTSPFLSKEPKSKEDKLLYNFAKAIETFFFESPAGNEPKMSGHTKFLMKIWWLNQLKGANRLQVLDEIDRHMRKLEHCWMMISAAYGELRVYCLS